MASDSAQTNLSIAVKDLPKAGDTGKAVRWQNHCNSSLVDPQMIKRVLANPKESIWSLYQRKSTKVAAMTGRKEKNGDLVFNGYKVWENKIKELQ